MCMKKITADEATKLCGRPAGITLESKVMIPIAKAEVAIGSLAIYTHSNLFRVDKRDKEKIIDPNPLAPLACSENGQREMLKSMGLGLSDDSKVWWVTLRKNFTAGLATAKDAMREVDSDIMTEMMEIAWPFDEMMGVELAPPCAGKATHWLVCQPRESDKNLHWGTLKRDALGIWATQENVYFVVPVGYQELLTASDAEPESREAFFEASAVEFRKACQEAMDRPIDERRAEQKRLNELPELRQMAVAQVQKYTQMVEKTPYYFELLQKNNEVVPKVEFDASNDKLFFSGEWHELSDQAFSECYDVLEQLQENVTEFETRSQKADDIRELLQGVNASVRDVFGKLNRTMEPKLFGNIVMIDLLENETVITVSKKSGKVIEECHISYDEPRYVSNFYFQLENLGLKEKDRYYDYDDIFEKPRRRLQEILLGFVGAKA